MASSPRAIREIEALSLHGGHAALDFVNTVDWRERSPHELLAGYDVLLHFARRLGIVEDAELGGLIASTERHPRKSEGALQRAIELREALYRTFASLAAAGTPASRDLATITAVFAEAASNGRLVAARYGYSWDWTGADPWNRVRWPVAAAAVDLLLSSRLERLKQCPHDGCGWVFLDRSKNASRRWCSMEGCGARAKMRRHYARSKVRQRSVDRASTARER